jgi:HD domain
MSGDRISWARSVAERYMPALGRRWAHVQAVAERAALLPFDGADQERLVAAAYLHDIGYSSELSLTGFHPLDGARHLRSLGEEDLALLVAHHTNARYEAELRGLAAYEDEFPYGGTLLDTALTFCDLTTSPDGRQITLEDRVAELVGRYGRDHVTSRAVLAGVPEFERGREQIRRLCCRSNGSQESDH